MFTTRPLTWLFVIATITINLAVFGRGDDRESPIIIGFIFGQIAALAIWAVRGSAHRMFRASCLIAATGTMQLFLNPQPEFFTNILIYILAIYFFTLLVEISYTLSSGNLTDDDPREKWRFPIIEFFGWTIIVAVVSLSSRYMSFDYINSYAEFWLIIFIFLVGPMSLAVLARNDLREMQRIKALIFVSTTTAAGWFIFKYYEDITIIPTQTAYLVAWMTVITLDNIRTEAAQVKSKLQDEHSNIETPKIYDPHPTGQAVPDDPQ